MNHSNIHKILFTIDGLARGGKERQMCIITRHLLDLGWEVNILTLRRHNVNYLHEYQIPEKCVQLVKNEGYRKSYGHFKTRLVQIAPEIVFSWDIQTSFYCLCLYKQLKFTFINGSIQHGIRLWTKTQLFRSLICWLSPFVVANSLAGLRANNMHPGKKTYILYNGIDPKFTTYLSQKEKLERRGNLLPFHQDTNSPLVFISVANLVPYKDYLTVLESLSIIKKHFSFYYIILGEGPMRATLEQKIEQYGLNSKVYMPGRVENVQDYLSISDILIHSSRGEGISNAILEAMFAGLPIIASDVGGTPELVYKPSSQLFRYKDVQALTSILKSSPEFLKRAITSGDSYRAHLMRFSVDTMIKKIISILEKTKHAK